MRVGYEVDEEYHDGASVNGTDYLRITPAQGVQPVVRDDKDRQTIKQNFNVLKRR
jgi:hypothetical protein